ncbi:hypothetical protein [Brevundimonas sp.]|uniref:hypothetical protein n=1 Tax=Brevundimonas sp. TaxID=1871086 RepID=UPI0035617E2A
MAPSRAMAAIAGRIAVGALAIALATVAEAVAVPAVASERPVVLLGLRTCALALVAPSGAVVVAIGVPELVAAVITGTFQLAARSKF